MQNSEWIRTNLGNGDYSFIYSLIVDNPTIKTMIPKASINIKCWKRDIDYLESVDINNIKVNELNIIDEIQKFVNENKEKHYTPIYETQEKSVIKELNTIKNYFSIITKEQYDDSDIKSLYDFCYIEIPCLKYISLNQNIIKDIIYKRDFQSDSRLIDDKAFLYLILKQELKNDFKTNDGDFLILLANPLFRGRTIINYKKENECRISSWYESLKEKNPRIKNIDYINENSALRYASEELLNDKTFIDKYKKYTNGNDEDLKYLNPEEYNKMKL